MAAQNVAETQDTALRDWPSLVVDVADQDVPS